MGVGLCIQRGLGILGHRSVGKGSHFAIAHGSSSASSDHTARLWEMSSGETVRQYNGHHKGRIT